MIFSQTPQWTVSENLIHSKMRKIKEIQTFILIRFDMIYLVMSEQSERGYPEGQLYSNVVELNVIKVTVNLALHDSDEHVEESDDVPRGRIHEGGRGRVLRVMRIPMTSERLKYKMFGSTEE